VHVQVGDAAGRKVDAVAAHHPLSVGPLGQAPDERPPLDARRAVVRHVALDVVDDVVAGAGLDALEMVFDREDHQ